MRGTSTVPVTGVSVRLDGNLAGIVDIHDGEGVPLQCGDVETGNETVDGLAVVVKVRVVRCSTEVGHVTGLPTHGVQDVTVAELLVRKVALVVRKNRELTQKDIIFVLNFILYSEWLISTGEIGPLRKHINNALSNTLFAKTVNIYLLYYNE